MGDARRGVAAAVIVAIGLVGLAACSSSGEHKVAVGESGSPAVGLNTARIRIKSLAWLDSGSPPSSDRPTDAVGAVRVESGDVDDVVVEGIIDLTTGVARFDDVGEPELPALSEIIATDGSIFATSEAEGESRRWVHFPADMSGLRPWVASDPVKLVGELRSAAARIDAAGSGVVEDDATTRSVLQLPAGTALSMWWGQLGGDLAATATIEVDEGGRLRALVVEYDVVADDDDPSIAMTGEFDHSRIELWDFGVDADLALPPASQTVEFDPDDPSAWLDIVSPAPGEVDLEGREPMWAVTDSEGNTSSEPMTTVEDLTHEMTGTWGSGHWRFNTGTNDAGESCAAFLPPIGDPEEDSWFAYGPAVCSEPPDEAMPLLLVNNAFVYDADFWYLAAVTAPNVTAIEVVTSDGKQLQSAFDTEADGLVVLGAKSTPASVIHVHFAGGQAVDCTLDYDDGQYSLTCPG